MSGYNGRRAPNFSQYLEDLNTIPSPYDQALQQQQQQQDSFNIDAELALFTNAEFLDFDNFDNSFGDINHMPLKYEGEQQQQQQARGDNVGAEDKEFKYLDLLNADFSNLPDYSSTDFNTSDPQMLQMQGSPFTAVPQVPSGPVNSNSNTSSTAQSTQSTPINPQTPAAPAPPARSAAPTPAPVAGTKRKQPPQHDGPLTQEEAARLAAEEDKRRRNTAASARFRIKKKQREQALERTVKETTEKNAALEARVSQLELENQWLKNLITEKNGGNASESDKEDIAAMFKKFLATQKAEAERNTSQSKQGVGTSA